MNGSVDKMRSAILQRRQIGVATGRQQRTVTALRSMATPPVSAPRRRSANPLTGSSRHSKTRRTGGNLAEKVVAGTSSRPQRLGKDRTTIKPSWPIDDSIARQTTRSDWCAGTKVRDLAIMPKSRCGARLG
ncbi:hypothetical protein CF326_g6115 [Tilletia indica]|nr:hypothetical protein CF326_g6115 [Tilletia indica]